MEEIKVEKRKYEQLYTIVEGSLQALGESRGLITLHKDLLQFIKKKIKLLDQQQERDKMTAEEIFNTGIMNRLEKFITDNNLEKKNLGLLVGLFKQHAESYHKEKMHEALIEFCKELKDYTSESHAILGHDEREASEFVDIYLNSIKGEQEK